jgi:hypothetical protein
VFNTLFDETAFLQIFNDYDIPAENMRWVLSQVGRPEVELTQDEEEQDDSASIKRPVDRDVDGENQAEVLLPSVALALPAVKYLTAMGRLRSKEEIDRGIQKLSSLATSTFAGDDSPTSRLIAAWNSGTLAGQDEHTPGRGEQIALVDALLADTANLLTVYETSASSLRKHREQLHEDRVRLAVDANRQTQKAPLPRRRESVSRVEPRNDNAGANRRANPFASPRP